MKRSTKIALTSSILAALSILASTANAQLTLQGQIHFGNNSQRQAGSQATYHQTANRQATHRHMSHGHSNWQRVPSQSIYYHETSPQQFFNGVPGQRQTVGPKTYTYHYQWGTPTNWEPCGTNMNRAPRRRSQQRNDYDHREPRRQQYDDHGQYDDRHDRGNNGQLNGSNGSGNGNRGGGGMLGEPAGGRNGGGGQLGGPRGGGQRGGGQRGGQGGALGNLGSPRGTSGYDAGVIDFLD